MRYLIVTVAMCMLLAYFPRASAQTPAQETSSENSPQSIDSTLKDEPRQAIEKGELFIVGNNEGKNKEDFLFKMGERVHIKATGKVARKLKMELEQTGASRTPILLFDGIKMASLPSAISQLDDGNILRPAFTLTAIQRSKNPAKHGICSSKARMNT